VRAEPGRLDLAAAAEARHRLRAGGAHHGSARGGRDPRSGQRQQAARRAHRDRSDRRVLRVGPAYSRGRLPRCTDVPGMLSEPGTDSSRSGARRRAHVPSLADHQSIRPLAEAIVTPRSRWTVLHTVLLAMLFSAAVRPGDAQVQPRRRAEAPTPAPAPGVDRLVAALLGDTPLVRDLETLTDEIGGRATGSPANLRAADWAVGRFRDAGVTVRKEAFTMPGLWLERSASATIRGDGVEFRPRIAALPFSTGTGAAGVTLPL